MARALILDTNLLVLFVVGAAGEHLIRRHKRLSAFTIADYRQVLQMIEACSRLVLVPHILAETSNLARQIDPAARAEVSAVLKLLIRRFPEDPVISRDAAEHNMFITLGLTDAVLLRLASDSKAVLMTTDHDLYGVAIGEGRDAYNFHHLQAAGFAVHARPDF